MIKLKDLLNETSDKAKLYKLYTKAMKMMPGSPAQKKVSKEIDKLRKKLGIKETIGYSGVKPGNVYKDSSGDILIIIKPWIRNKWHFVNFNLKHDGMVSGVGTTPESFFEDEKVLKLSSSHKNKIKKILKNPEDIDYLEKDGSVKVRDILRVIK
jgi:hypothetical protein